MMQRRTFLITALPFLAPGLLRSADRAAELSGALAGIQQQRKLPALAVSIFKGRSELFRYFRGVRKAGSAVKIASADAWHLGSLTKSMTATLAALMADRQQFRWESTLEQFFPNCHAKHKGTTLRQLAEHRGGFSHDGPAEIWSALTKRAGSAAECRKWWANQLLEAPPEIRRGQFEYSNAGYAVLGHVLELLTGDPWESHMRSQLFSPLGMKTAGFGPTATAARSIDGIWGHRDGLPVVPGPQADNPPALGPAGTAHASLDDVLRYARFHLAKGTAPQVKLSTAQTAILHETRYGAKSEDGYACGWYDGRRDWATGRCLNHAGSNEMNFALLWLMPKMDLGFVILTNSGGKSASPICEEIAGQIVETFLR